METQKVNFVAELPDVVIGKLENIQSQVLTFPHPPSTGE